MNRFMNYSKETIMDIHEDVATRLVIKGSSIKVKK